MADETNNERNKLNRNIREKKDEIVRLESVISNLSSLEETKNTLETDIESLTENKTSLESFLSENSTKKTTLTSKVEGLTTEKQTLDTYIETNNPVRETLTAELAKLETDKDGLTSENSELVTSSSDLKSEIKTLKSEKKTLEGSTKELREKYGLYSKDMKEMSKDSNSQLIKYSWSAILSIGATIVLMIILLNILIKSNPFSTDLMEFFKHQPNFRFYTLLTIRVSISAVFVFFIIIFLNLSRGFISQYIKARNRLTALRVTDFLIERIQSKHNEEFSEEDQLNLEREKIKEQVELLSDQLPKLMDLGNSSFDKTSKTESPIKVLKEVKDLIK